MPSAFAATEIDLDELIDLDRYPIHELTSSARAAVVEHARSEMQDDGCCRLSGFVRLEAVDRMRAEATAAPRRRRSGRPRTTTPISPPTTTRSPRATRGARSSTARPVSSTPICCSPTRRCARSTTPTCCCTSSGSASAPTEADLPMGRPARPQPVRRHRSRTVAAVALRRQRVHREHPRPEGRARRRVRVRAQHPAPRLPRTTSTSPTSSPAGATAFASSTSCRATSSSSPAASRCIASRRSTGHSTRYIGLPSYVLRSVPDEPVVPLDDGLRTGHRVPPRSATECSSTGWSSTANCGSPSSASATWVAPMARNILAAGFDTVVTDLDPAKVESVVAAGAVAAADAATAVDGRRRRAHVTPWPEQVQGVGEQIVPDDGVRRDLDRPQHERPRCARHVATLAAAHGVRLLDAPVSGGVEGAEAGTLSVLVGGDTETSRAVPPPLRGDRRTLRPARARTVPGTSPRSPR